MNKRGPIVVIEDDMDDRQLLQMVFGEIGYPNEVVYFRSSDEAMDYLMQPSVFPFLLLCDINLPGANGFELRQLTQSCDTLRDKCIPFLFFTTAAGDKAVHDAFKLSVQGFFVKPSSYERQVKIMRLILEYWSECYSPMRLQGYTAPLELGRDPQIGATA